MTGNPSSAKMFPWHLKFWGRPLQKMGEGGKEIIWTRKKVWFTQQQLDNHLGWSSIQYIITCRENLLKMNSLRKNSFQIKVQYGGNSVSVCRWEWNQARNRISAAISSSEAWNAGHQVNMFFWISCVMSPFSTCSQFQLQWTVMTTLTWGLHWRFKQISLVFILMVWSNGTMQYFSRIEW
jgi:hypothetical protein